MPDAIARRAPTKIFDTSKVLVGLPEAVKSSLGKKFEREEKMIAGLLTLWFVCLGMAVMVGQHRQFIRWSQNTLLWPLKAGWKAVRGEVKTISRNFWRAHRIRVMSFFFGAGIMGVVLNPIGFWWALFLLLIALGGLLAGLAIAIWRGARDDFQEWLRDQALWLWARYGTQIRWAIAGAIVVSILVLGPT